MFCHAPCIEIPWQSSMNRAKLISLFAVAVLLGSFSGQNDARAQSLVCVERLRCEYQVNPLGIDAATPSLSWILTTPERGQKQIAYQILVSDSADKLANDQGNLWDSGRVKSSNSTQVLYGGRLLTSSERCYWKIRIWDAHEEATPWSPTATWEMGLLSGDAWHGKWINDGREMSSNDENLYRDDPAPLFRKSFVVEKPIQSARLYISGLGYYEALLNGERIGNSVLDPAWTTYSKRVLYSTYDVTSQLNQGQNCLGVMLGNGWYNVLPMRMWGQLNLRQYLPVGRPRVIVQLNIKYVDGSTDSVVSDESWRTTPGPILRNNIYLGEIYDARREITNWSQPECDDAKWETASIATDAIGELRSQTQPPIRETEIFSPISISQPKPGVYIFDLGHNIAGYAQLRVRGPQGTAVKLRFGELLYPDGTLNVMTSVCGQIKKPDVGGPGAPSLAEQSDTYILRGSNKGEPPEIYTPRFTYHAFRFVEVTGYPGEPALEAITGMRVNTALTPVGTFSCSNDLINRIQKLVVNTFPSNLMGIQTDCPGRERFGYGDDIACACEAHLFNFDMAAFYAKTVRDFSDAARPNGALTLLAPWTGHAIGGFDAGGGSFADRSRNGDNAGSGPLSGVLAHPLLLERLYQFYGDRRLVAEEYETARRSLEFIRSHSQNNIITVGLGDWSSTETTSTSLLDTAFYYDHARIVARLARVLGKVDDEAKYESLCQDIKSAFIREFLKPETGEFGPHTQAAQAFALFYGLVPTDEQNAATRVLVDDVLVRHKGHLTTGIFGTKYLLSALTQLGRADVASQIVTQKTFPGWGYMLEKGATTLWEVWDFSDDIYSHNHSMFGTVSAWFFTALAGIQPDPEAIGFNNIVLKPHLTSDLTWVKATYDSMRGEIKSNWRIEDSNFHWDVVIPPNVSARVYLPAEYSKNVKVLGRPITESEFVKYLGFEDGQQVYQFESGKYLIAAQE